MAIRNGPGPSKAPLLFFLCLSCFACAAERKLTHMEIRAPASLAQDKISSERRERLANPSSYPGSCPPELSRQLPFLVMERVQFPPCPSRLVQGFSAARNRLSAEEVSNLEELLKRQCRSLSRDESGDAGFGPREAGAGPSAPAGQEPAETADLRSALGELRAQQAPFDRWVQAHGEQVITDELLPFLDGLVIRGGCRLGDQEVDQSYRTIRALEELAKLGPEDSIQRTRIESVLRGIHRLIDRKIEEYFR